MKVLITTGAACAVLGGKHVSTEAMVRELKSAGLEPVNKPADGHRFFARWDLAEVQKAAIDLTERRRIEVEQAEARAQARRAKEVIAEQIAHRPRAVTSEKAVEDFTKILTSLYNRLAEVERKVDEVYRLWTE